jgi:hypothetical protein
MLASVFMMSGEAGRERVGRAQQLLSCTAAGAVTVHTPGLHTLHCFAFLSSAAVAGAMKLMMHEQGAANPILQYFTPKMDGALGKVHCMTGLQLPVEQEQYANMLFIMGAMELLGGVLFTLNVKLGAVILVSEHTGQRDDFVSGSQRTDSTQTASSTDSKQMTGPPLQDWPYPVGKAASRRRPDFSTLPPMRLALCVYSCCCRWACCYPLRW